MLKYGGVPYFIPFVFAADLVDADDVRVTNLRGSSCFAEKHLGFGSIKLATSR